MMRRRRRAPAPAGTKTRTTLEDKSSPKQKENMAPPESTPIQPPPESTTPTQPPPVVGSTRKSRRAHAVASSPVPTSLRKTTPRRCAAMFDSGRKRRRPDGGGGVAKRKAYFEGLISAFENSSQASAQKFCHEADGADLGSDLDTPLQDVLAVDCVCDEKLSVSELGKRMCAALARLKRMKNFAEASSGTDAHNKEPPEEEATSDDEDESTAQRKNLVADLASSLAVDRFASHASDIIRLLTACLLSELLRVSAPEPPLPLAKLASVARLFVEQLLPLGVDKSSDPLHEHRFGLLEQLATVKIFLVFSDDTSVGLDLFAASYALTRASHPHKLTALVSSILISLFEEVEVVSQPLLDAALAPLIPENGYSPEALRLAERVVAASCNILQVPVCNFFNAALRSKHHQRNLPGSDRKRRRRAAGDVRHREDGAEDSDDLESGDNSGKESLSRGELIAELSLGNPGQMPESELLIDVEALLIRINRISPDILIYVIPNFERDLRSTEVDRRLRCVRLLSSLFTACSDMVRAYPNLLADFIARSKDADSCIRVELCEAAAQLIIDNPPLRGSLSERLSERILDKEEKVRLAAVASIASAATVITDNKLLALVADRVKDKKIYVRQAALRSLETVYRVGYLHIDTSSSPIREWKHSEVKANDISPGPGVRNAGTGADRVLASSVTNRFSWIPACLLQAMVTMYNYKDYDTALEIEQALFDRMHIGNGRSSTATFQLKSFCAMLGAFDTSTVVMMMKTAIQRKRVRDSVSTILSLRQETKSQRQASAKDLTSYGEASDVSLQARNAPVTFSKRPRIRKGGDLNLNTATEKSSFSKDVATAGKLLAAALPDMRIGSSSSRKLALDFAEIADLNVYKKLSAVLDPESTAAIASDAAQDAIARVGTKSALGEFMRRLILPRCRPGVFSCDFVLECLKICVSNCSGSVHRNDNRPKKEGPIDGRLGNMAVDAEANPRDFETGGTPLLPVQLGFVRYLDLACTAMPSVFHGENAALVSEILTQGNKEQVGEVEAREPSEVFRCMLITCCLKIVHRLGQSVFLDWTENIVDSCHKLALGWSADPEHCSRHAKWAVRTFVSLLGSGDQAHVTCKSLISELSKCLDDFDGNLEYLIAPMSALTHLAELSPHFKDVALSSFDFARALLMGSMNSKVHDAIGKLISPENTDSSAHNEARLRTGRRLSQRSFGNGSPMSSSGAEVSEVFMFFHATRTLSEAVRRGSKLLVASLKSLESSHDEASTAVATLLSVTVEKNGNVFGFSGVESIPGLENVVSNDDSILDAVADMCGICRLAAGCAVLRVGCYPQLASKIQPTDFLSVVLCAQDEHPDIRSLFARKVAKRVSRQRLPFRWITSLALMAIDPDKDNVAEVKNLLDDCIRARRRALNYLRQDDSTGKRSMSHLLPEAVLPVLVWIAANHPDAAVDEENRYIESERYLDFFLDRILGNGEYASILNQFLNSLAMARDATDVSDGERLSSSQRISDIARIGTALLQKKRSARKWTLIEHEGKVTLPSDLFRIASYPPASSGPGPNIALDVAKRFDRDAAQLTKSAERRDKRSSGQRRSTPPSFRKEAVPVPSLDNLSSGQRRSTPTSSGKAAALSLDKRPSGQRRSTPPSALKGAVRKDETSNSPVSTERVVRALHAWRGPRRKTSELTKSSYMEGSINSPGDLYNSDGNTEMSSPLRTRRPKNKRLTSKPCPEIEGTHTPIEIVQEDTKGSRGEAVDMEVDPAHMKADGGKPPTEESSERKRPASENGSDWFDGGSHDEGCSKSTVGSPSGDNSSVRRSGRRHRRPNRFS